MPTSVSQGILSEKYRGSGERKLLRNLPGY